MNVDKIKAASSETDRDRKREQARKALPEAKTETATETETEAPAQPSERAAVAIRRRKCRNISFYFRSSRFLAERKVKMPYRKCTQTHESGGQRKWKQRVGKGERKVRRMKQGRPECSILKRVNCV